MGRRYLFLELAVVWRGWWSAPPPRRKHPIQPARFWYLATPILLFELACIFAANWMPNR
jgi:hypothetical protein